MNVVVICEFSGIVREAFKNVGCNALSIDLLPTEISGEHLIADVTTLDNDFWKQFDLAICHPPCTYLASSGARWFKDPGRIEKQKEALEFVRYLMNLPIERICIENPVGIISTHIRKPDQIIQPYQFGDPHSKKTCLWLKNLPKLIETKNVYEDVEWVYYYSKKKGIMKRMDRKHAMANIKNRWKIRSKTFPGVAKAMAEQWSKLKSS